jgi:hypothetical protein
VSVQEIKQKLATLHRQEQDEVIAFLFHLRHTHEGDYRSSVARRLADAESAHWLSPDEFERRLDQKSE